MAKKGKVDLNGFVPDFSPDECERRLTEVVLRCLGKPATFDLKTGQPLKGEQLSTVELRRRGYDEPPPRAET